MGDIDSSFIRCNFVELFVGPAFRDRVKGCGGFVKNQDGRVFVKRLAMSSFCCWPPDKTMPPVISFVMGVSMPVGCRKTLPKPCFDKTFLNTVPVCCFQLLHGNILGGGEGRDIDVLKNGGIQLQQIFFRKLFISWPPIKIVPESGL